MKYKCEECIFWEMNGVSQHNIKKGICRRYPPLYGKFPITYAVDWCGEFKKKVNPFETKSNK